MGLEYTLFFFGLSPAITKSTAEESIFGGYERSEEAEEDGGIAIWGRSLQQQQENPISLA